MATPLENAGPQGEEKKDQKNNTQGQTEKKRGPLTLLRNLASTTEGKLALLQAGVTLMQGARPGESAVGHLGRTIGQGANTFIDATQNRQEQEAEQAEFQQQQQLIDAQTGYYGARENYYDAAAGAEAASAEVGPFGQIDPNDVYKILLEAEQEAASLEGRPPNAAQINASFQALMSGQTNAIQGRYIPAIDENGQQLLDRGFPVAYDSVTGRQVTLGNPPPEQDPTLQENILSLTQTPMAAPAVQIGQRAGEAISGYYKALTGE